MLLRVYLLLMTTLLLSLLTTLVFAAPLSKEDVPEPLKPWVDWALHEQQGLDCPYLYNAQSRSCQWPSRLTLELNGTGGTFTQHWQVFDKTQVRLPGDNDNWPQLVINEAGETLLVASKNGFPYVTLPAGRHTLSGRFLWQKLPKALRINPQSGLINLRVNGRNIINPSFNKQHQLWLTQDSSETAREDNLDIQVFRKITDSHPIQITTSIKLRVSGKQRNALLSPVLPDDFIALQLNSPLPARMDGKQQLQVQLRPGEWTLEVTGRAVGDRTEFALPTSQAPWPQQEVWVFEADGAMRQVEVGGVNSIDPNQTRLPGNWKTLPAYLLTPGDALKLTVMQRGAPQTRQQQLRLQREMWLDFDGQGYTLKDQLSGQAPRQSRLNVVPDIELGRVSIDGQPQFITRQNNQNKSQAEPNETQLAQEMGAVGVEIRNEHINLQAESRYNGGRSTPPVNGWQHDLQTINTTLYLPPGWFLFASSGTDNLPDSWVQDWSLLDLFLVMIIALAVAYLYDWRWGGFTLLTLVMIWHQNNAPQFIWLNLLAVIALLKVMPEGLLKRWLNRYRWLSLLVLVIIVLPYLIDTLRIGLYPQLAYQHQIQSNVAQGRFGGNAERAEAETVAAEVSMMHDEADDPLGSMAQQNRPAPAPRVQNRAKEYASKLAKPSPRDTWQPKKKAINMQAIDPDSMIQTGPGLPSWRSYQALNLHWSGPVKADEQTRLILVDPKLNLLIRLAGIVLLLVLSWRMLRLPETGNGTGSDQGGNNGAHWRGLSRWFRSAKQTAKQAATKATKTTVSILLLLPLVLMLIQPTALRAEPVQVIPDPSMLQTLQERLTAPPDCLPDCAQIEQMQLLVIGDSLTMRLRVHAATATAIPLPGSQDTWLAETIILNQQLATAIRRDNAQQLWLALPVGLHDIRLRGQLPARNSVPLPLALKPHYVNVQTANDSGWTISGIRDNGTPESQLQLNRVLSDTEKSKLEQERSVLPTFVRVERRLQLGLDWQVETTVRRLAPLGTPLSITLPLLPNEQPMSEQLSVRKQRITVNLGAQQNVISWSSRLKPGDKIVLTAAENADYLESWQVATSPIWHIDAQGLPVNRFLREDGQTVPVWQPWPGETLTLNVSRPEGVPGQTVTVLGSKLAISTGKRANDVKLALNIRSSRGVQHTLQLPENAEVQSLSIDGVTQRIQTTDQQLSLTLKPGNQQVNVAWRETEALGLSYHFPEVDINLPSVNTQLAISLPRDRWVMWTNGPVMGPAVLFWGVLLVLLMIAVLLGYSKLTPLKSWQWFLLGIGLSQTETTLMILVAGWLIALAMREKFRLNTLPYWQFNALQLALAGLTVIALAVLAAAVANGLLGMPEMQIAGNGSSAYYLQWYQDRSDEVLPQPWLVSVPLWIYRVLMLLWALWLAAAVLGWLRWGWTALNQGDLWRARPPKPAVIKEDVKENAGTA